MVKKLKKSLLNLQIKDIHNHLQYLNNKKEHIQHHLCNVLPQDTSNEIITFQDELNKKRLQFHKINCNNKIKTILKTNSDKNNNNLLDNIKHKIMDRNYSYDNDPWFVNLSNQQIHNHMQDLLRLHS